MYCSSMASQCLSFSVLKVGMIAFPWEKGSQESRACDMLGMVLVPSAGSGLCVPPRLTLSGTSTCKPHSTLHEDPAPSPTNFYGHAPFHSHWSQGHPLLPR